MVTPSKFQCDVLAEKNIMLTLPGGDESLHVLTLTMKVTETDRQNYNSIYRTCTECTCAVKMLKLTRRRRQITTKTTMSTTANNDDSDDDVNKEERRRHRRRQKQKQ